ncbi:MAG: DUF3488 domain-containing protein [Proteobacteria bacterium]|nr:DUF3488 domain-containing protein [Pseudomonadota bacterium]
MNAQASERANARAGANTLPSASAATSRIGFDRLCWTAACLGLALLPHVSRLKPWISLTILAAVGIRLALAYRGRGVPPALLRLAISGSAIALLFLQFHTFNGLEAGTSLLTLMAGLKFMEARALRDVRIIVLIVYFLCLASLLGGDSFALLFYLLAVSWLTTAVLLRFTAVEPPPSLGQSLRFAGRLVVLALPLAVALWLFFPRFAGPLWQLPSAQGAGHSGLSDRMSPGDLSELSLSDEVAMRVRFDGLVPPPAQRYWRGPVLDVFDGRSWSRGEFADLPASALMPSVPDALTAAPTPDGGAGVYRYTISLEPHRRRWLLPLEQPLRWDAPRAFLTADAVLLQPDPVTRPLDLRVESDTTYLRDKPLREYERRRQTRLPSQFNPRTQELARRLRAAAADDAAFVQAVLQLFRREQFYYTLTPPRLADNAVDEFLFETRRGFCEHYASAFAVLMRAGGVPARVVTGYQGGEFNRFAGYWIVRQSDAHAWNEVWLEGRGWVRADPTAAVAPERIERGSAGAQELSGAGNWYRRQGWFTDLRLRLDQFSDLWRDAILKFDQRSQLALLRNLHIPEPDTNKLVLCLAAALVLTSLWLAWQVRRGSALRQRDPVLDEFRRLQRRLRARGVGIKPSDSALGIAAIVAREQPALAARVAALCELYNHLRYGRPEEDTGVTPVSREPASTAPVSTAPVSPGAQVSPPAVANPRAAQRAREAAMSRAADVRRLRRGVSAL